jgi:hypothetical protein
VIYENALNPTAVLFREDQMFAPWVYVVLGMVAFKVAFPDMSIREGLSSIHPTNDPAAYVVLTVISLLTVFLMRMSTEVSPTCVTVSFGWLPIYRLKLRIEELQTVEPCSYRPLRDTLGWGIRRSWSGEIVLSARGNRGVRIKRSDGSFVLIGSQRPEDLAGVIESARRNLLI